MKEQKEENKAPWWQPGLVLFSRLSSWIAGPIILAVFVGRWLDGKYNTEPWLFLLAVGIAFAISMTGIVRDATKEMKRIENENGKNKNGKSDKDS